MEQEILRLINSHNGELSWYQLDRALSYQHKYVDGIHRRHERAGRNLGRFLEECCILGQYAADANQIEVADARREQGIIECV